MLVEEELDASAVSSVSDEMLVEASLVGVAVEPLDAPLVVPSPVSGAAPQASIPAVTTTPDII